MARLFEDASGGNNKKGKRRWQCFVCGQNYDDYVTYKRHILESHEEGREFLKCPACEAPVRDMKSHYKSKHPSRMMPKGIQTRVAVWKDFKRTKKGEKKVTTRKPTFHRGEFDSKKNGQLISYRSGLERDFYDLLEEDKDVTRFYGELYKVPYFWKGKWHDYIPDIRVDYVDGSTEIWEIKPANQTDYEQNRAKWAAADQWATNHGWGFVVHTEVGLGKLKTKVKRQNLLNE